MAACSLNRYAMFEAAKLPSQVMNFFSFAIMIVKKLCGLFGYSFSGGFGGDPVDESLQDRAGADLEEAVRAVRDHVPHRLRPADRGGELAQEVVLDDVRVRGGEGGEAFRRPWRAFSLPFMKKETVIGTIGNTHGVSSIANPHRIASRISAHRLLGSWS